MTAKEKHLVAMRLMDEAEVKLREAYRAETEAARESNDPLDKAVLYRSAAWIAISLGRYSTAEETAYLGLLHAGRNEIRAELQHVWRVAKMLAAEVE